VGVHIMRDVDECFDSDEKSAFIWSHCCGLISFGCVRARSQHQQQSQRVEILILWIGTVEEHQARWSGQTTCRREGWGVQWRDLEKTPRKCHERWEEVR
jgi:hypothetical protein